MPTLRFTNIAVFILFFGVALIEALREGDLLQAVIFLSLGLVMLWADFSRSAPRQ